MRFFNHLMTVIGLTCLLSGVAAVQAQDEAQWYWAWREDSGQLLSYTTDGQTNTLIEQGVTFAHGWRLDAARGMMLVEQGESHDLYFVAAEQASPLQPFADKDAQNLAAADNWNLVALSDTHAVLAAYTRVPDSDALLVDLNAGTYTALPGLVFQPFTHVKFSEDGRYLRYLSRESTEAENQTLYELKLETGAARVIVTFDDFFPNIRPDTYGDYWLSREREGDNFVIGLISLSGEINILSSQPLTREMQEITLLGDYLVSFIPTCEADCRITVSPIVEGETTHLTLPAVEDLLIVTYLRQIDETRWLVGDSEGNVWSLGSDGSATYLSSPSLVSVSQPLTQRVSPDGRFVLVTQETSNNRFAYAVWDHKQDGIVLSSNEDVEFYIVQIIYGDEGFVVTEDIRRFWLYRYSDEQVVPLPEVRGRVYFQALADGSVLYVQRGTDEAGVYRYDPANDSSILLVANAQAIYM